MWQFMMVEACRAQYIIYICNYVVIFSFVHLQIERPDIGVSERGNNTNSRYTKGYYEEVFLWKLR